MQIRFTLNKVLLFLLMIFPITTIYQGLPHLESLNKVLALLIMIILLTGFVLEKMRLVDVIYLIVGIFLSVLCIYYTGHAYSISTITGFAFWIFFFCYLSNNYISLMEELVYNWKMLLSITVFWEVSVFVSFFFSRSYVKEWGGTYFQSFSNGLHRFAMTCFVIIAYAFILLQLTNKYIYYLFFIIPFLGLLISGTRTYVVIGLFFAVAIYYLRCKNSKLFYLSIVPFLALAIIFIMLSPIGNKISDTFAGEGYFGYWATLTNGRSMFWVVDLQGYWDLPVWGKLIGNGANYVYDLNLNSDIAALIWAHNDFINILCTNGALGLLLYSCVFGSFISRNTNKDYVKTFIPMFAFYFMLGFNAMFNMLYTYTSAVIAVPFMLFSLYTLPNERNKYIELATKS